PEAGGLRPEAWRRNAHPLRIGFDAIRALRNTTGLGNYARGVLRALHQYTRSLELHLYSPAPPRPGRHPALSRTEPRDSARPPPHRHSVGRHVSRPDLRARAAPFPAVRSL